MNKIILTMLFGSISLFSDAINARNPFLSRETMQLIEHASKGDVEKQLTLAKHYYMGIGLPADREQALIWLEKAAQQGSAQAQLALGLLFLDGDGSLKADSIRAVQWLEKAAEQGEMQSLDILLELYKNGGLIQANETKFAHWAEKGAALDNVNALYALGELYRIGKHKPQNMETAFKLFKQAADKGHLDAMANVGVMLFAGVGTQVDKVKGYGYWLIAKQYGNKVAINNITIQDERKALTAKEKKKAQEFAKRFTKGKK